MSRLKWEIHVKDAYGTVRCIKSGPWLIAKQGEIEVTYMLTHKDSKVMAFFTNREDAMQAAEDEAAFLGKEKQNER